MQGYDLDLKYIAQINFFFVIYSLLHHSECYMSCKDNNFFLIDNKIIKIIHILQKND